MSSGGHAALNEEARALTQLEPLPSADEYDSEVDMARLSPVAEQLAACLRGIEAERLPDGWGRTSLHVWSAVSIVFPEAWGLPPKASRLMHGAGLRAMGRLMDVIMPSIRCQSKNAIKQTVIELEKIEPICKWTSGRWIELDGIKWNEIQNVPRHINLLSSVIIRAYTLSREVGQ